MRQEIDRFDSTLEIKEVIAPNLGWFCYLEVAILSGTASVIFGSLICGTALIAIPGEKLEPENLLVIFFCIIYSAIIIFPVSLLIGYPLISLSRQMPGWTKIAISTFAGTFLSTILLSSASWLFGSVLQVAAIGTIYGFIFGLSAAWLITHWCARAQLRRCRATAVHDVGLLVWAGGSVT